MGLAWNVSRKSQREMEKKEAFSCRFSVKMVSFHQS